MDFGSSCQLGQRVSRIDTSLTLPPVPDDHDGQQTVAGSM